MKISLMKVASTTRKRIQKQRPKEKNKSNGMYGIYHGPISPEWIEWRY